MELFSKKEKIITKVGQDFEYLDPEALYFDSACQTMRPQQVIDAQNEYYTKFNACGERVKYEWGEKVDKITEETRQGILDLLGLSKSEYIASFTLNTTYGINLVLSQLPKGFFGKIVTSEIEHNSVFLTSMVAAKRLNIPRLVLKRLDDGSLEYSKSDLEKAVVVVNSSSNIDDKQLANLSQLAKDVHEQGGILLIDAAQSMGHNLKLVKGADVDALFFSGHKMYGPSMGVIVIKKDLLRKLDILFTGGGTVEDVQKDSFIPLGGEDLYSRLEMGLQNFAGIIGLNEGLKWLKNFKPNGLGQDEHQKKLSNLIFESLSKNSEIKLINKSPSPIISFYLDKIDSHKLGLLLSPQKIMVRSGYFCCHYYLKNLRNLPPLLRFSIGLHNTEAQVGRAMEVLGKIIRNV